MKDLDIVVSGDPKPQSRPRVTVNGTYSSSNKALKAWRSAVKAAAIGKTIEDGTLGLTIVIGMPVKDRKLYGRLHASRPDFDNLAKAILDAMQIEGKPGTGQRLLFPLRDDSLIASAWIVKVYSPIGFARILLERIDTVADAVAAITRATEIVAELEK